MNVFAKILGGIIRTFRTPLKLWSAQQKLTTLVAALAVVFAGVTTTAVVMTVREDDIPETTPPTLESTVQSEPTTLPPTDGTTEPSTAETTEPEPVITDKVYELQELYKQNPHTAGWIQIPNTRVNEVVMFSPDRPDKYLYANFQGHFSAGGTAYIDEVCDIDPETKVLQIFGHHMLNGSHFADLFLYEQESFWEKNRYVYYTTLEEARCYEIFAVVKDRDLPETAEGIKYYEFVSPADKETHDMYIEYFMENSLYDTGVTVEYDDRFVMLVTCSYHEKDGRLYLVAKEVPYVDPEA